MTTYDVVIIGAGVFGLSAAAQFARCGKSVFVIDKYSVPSPISAANDYNKIVRLEYNDEVYARLAVEAMQYWHNDADDFLPRGLLHESYSHCGRISIVPPESSPRYKFESQSLALLREKFGRCKEVQVFENDLTCGGKFPQFCANGLVGKTLRYNPDCGIGIAGKSLIKMKEYCESLGVKFREGDGVKNITPGSIVHITTCSGKTFNGRQVLVACGANSSNVIDLSRQMRATGLYVGHIQLTDKEYEKYRDIPVVFDPTLGYFFPPDRATKILKVCASASSTYDPESKSVKPRYKYEEPETVKSIPIQSVVQIRTILGQYMPDLLYKKKKLRDIIGCKICWISDTSNSDFIIDQIPHMQNVFISCGDSGHGYKFLPNIGYYIKRRMDGNLSLLLKEKWQWRESAWTKDVLDWRVEHNRKHIGEIDWYEERFSGTKL